MMDSTERAKQVLEILEYELRNVDSCDQKTLEFAFAAQIEEALRDQMRELNKATVNKVRSQEEIQQKLIKVRKRERP